MELSEKLKLMRTRERLTQRQMADEVGVYLGSYKNYELGLRKEMSSLALLKITNHPRFTKYTLWLMCDEFPVACEQVSPV
jgi:transcriptional regulator with XRE-family HTH domain